jgi:leucyl aminopeptidase
VVPYQAARQTVEVARAALYRFDELKSRTDPGGKLARLGIGFPRGTDLADVRRGVKVGLAIANGSDLARDLGNRPPNVCTPSHLADVARGLAKKFPRLQAKVLTEVEMKRLGMGALLSVTQGAEEPARLIVLEYRGAAAKSAPIVL